MSVYGRAVRGAEAGVIAAASIELSFFVLDLVRLQPLATPISLSGVVPGPGGFVLDLTSLTGVVAGLGVVYQLLMLTLTHVLSFGLVGVLASLLYDWRQPLSLDRLAVVTVLCTAAFYGTVAASSSLMTLDAVGVPLLVGMNLLAAFVLGSSLRFVCVHLPEEETTGPAATPRPH